MSELNGLTKEAEESLWKQHSVVVDLYKFFFEWILKLNVFYYTITGALLGFFLSSPGEGFIRYSLLLPVVFGAFLAWLFFVGRQGLKITQQEVYNIENLLKPELKFDIRFLPKFLAMNAAICALTAVALLVVTFALHSEQEDTAEIRRFILSGDCEIIPAEARKAPNPGPATEKQRAARIICR